MDFDNEELLYKPASLWVRGLIWAIVGSFSFGFIYACFARMDEVVIAKGELQALGAERPIRAPISGTVNEIFIKEGDSVEKDSRLLRFDSNVLLAKKEGLEAKLEELESRIQSEKEILKEISILADAGGIQKLQYLQQKNKVSELGYEKKQVEAEIKELNFDKSKTLLVSPVKGKVFNLISVSKGFASTIICSTPWFKFFEITPETIPNDPPSSIALLLGGTLELIISTSSFSYFSFISAFATSISVLGGTSKSMLQ